MGGRAKTRFRWATGRKRLVVVTAVVAALTATIAVAAPAGATTLRGSVQSGRAGLAGYSVSLYAAVTDRKPHWLRLGSDMSDRSGRFKITYSIPKRLGGKRPLLFVEATRGRAMLAGAIGGGSSPVPGDVVVDELTTVAAGNAFAQFVRGSEIGGNRYGMDNAVHMAANLANPETGDVGVVLATTPNGIETSTLATFDSLANAVASCVADDHACTALFRATTPRGARAPDTVLEAVANIVKYPSYPTNRDPVFDLSKRAPLYRPALRHQPTNWLLFVKFTGGHYSVQDANNLMSGPGNFAIDPRGDVWVDENAVPEPPDHFACAGMRLQKFYPWGEPFPHTPYTGGGLSGAGWGITFDPAGRIWVGNFGFQDPPCALLPQAAPNDSVSLFQPDGHAVSGDAGYTDGNVSWPQGTVSDTKGNIWIANCGNDSLTEFPAGDHRRAVNIPLGPAPAAGDPQMKPFGISIDARGNLWVTDNRSNTVSVLSRSGRLIATLPGTYHGKTVLSHPVGNAADLEGNIWVANSDWLDVPCPTRRDLGSAKNPSITLYRAGSRTPALGSPFTGGGLTLPWGVAVDGNDTVWAFNFGAVPVGKTSTMATSISRFCGVTTRNCPKGKKTGDPISPSSGYQSNALQRITAGAIDPSGNIWITGNWKTDAHALKNPFANFIVIAVGAAGPLKTPLIGPPVAF